MDYAPIVPTLRLSSMKESLAFYTEFLGFSVKWSWSDQNRFAQTDRPEFACLECGAAVLFLSQESGGTESWLFVKMHFVEDVDTLAASLKGRAQVDGLPTNQPWGSREFSLKDPDGHSLRFSCPADRTRHK